jgi:Putative beta-barrel porin-2, OmpL-like. bbp2
VNLSVEKNWKKLAAKLDMAAGPRTQELYTNTTDIESLASIKQAYISYFASKKLTLRFGALTSHFGFEYTEPFDNYVYTNSLVFTFIPAFYTGLKAEYNLTDKWQIMLGIFNDSNVKIDRNKGKHIGSKIAYTSDKFSFTTDFIAGKEGDSTAILMQDMYVNYAISEKFAIGSVFHWMSNHPKTEKNSRWFGTGFYAKYQVNTPFSLGFRGERLNDSDAYYFGETGDKIWSWTFAGQYQIGRFKIEPEIRYDLSNKAIFSHATKGFVKNEPSFLLAGLFRF